jgi:hypothetical protein
MDFALVLGRDLYGRAASFAAPARIHNLDLNLNLSTTGSQSRHLDGLAPPYGSTR